MTVAQGLKDACHIKLYLPHRLGNVRQVETMKGKTEEDEKATQVYAALAVGFVCVIVGLPLWWKSTEVYRVSLPYSDIEQLSQTMVQYAVDVEVVSYDPSLNGNDLASLSTQLMSALDVKPVSNLGPKYRTSIRDKTDQETRILSSSKSVEDFDDQLSAVYGVKHNKYYIHLLPSEGKIKVTTPHVGLHNSIFFRSQGKGLSKVVEKVSAVLREVVVREGVVTKGYKSAKGTRGRKPDKDSMRSVRFHPGYDVTFTLVSPQPDVLDVQWEIEQGIKDYLQPLLDSVEKYAAINVKSQVLFFTGMLIKPSKDPVKGGYYYSSKDLPHLINPLEGRLGSPASNNPDLNFLVYVPPRENHPLYIREDTGTNLPSNSFLSPQWGGVYIHNVPSPDINASLPMKVDVDMRLVMEVFLVQLRMLLNLHVLSHQDVVLSPLGSLAVREWELDGWLRARCVENMASATASLQSLAQLLGKISNIVINDDIGNEVESAVESIKESQQYLIEGDLEQAFLASRKAIISSEKAFFDPSLLELLYFPEDQKFAIYIPLFLPISFPVLASLYQSFKWYKSRAKVKQD